MEVEAYIARATVWQSFWDDYGPEATKLEGGQHDLLELLVTGGKPGNYRRVVDRPGNRQRCDLLAP